MATDNIDPRVAVAPPSEGPGARDALLLATSVEDRNISFLRDLEAANALKSFLVGSGVEVPGDVLAGLAELTESYLSEDPGTVSPPSGASASPEPPAYPERPENP